MLPSAAGLGASRTCPHHVSSQRVSPATIPRSTSPSHGHARNRTVPSPQQAQRPLSCLQLPSLPSPSSLSSQLTVVLANSLSHLCLQWVYFGSCPLPVPAFPQCAQAGLPRSPAKKPAGHLIPLSIYCWVFGAVHNPTSSSVEASQ